MNRDFQSVFFLKIGAVADVIEIAVRDDDQFDVRRCNAFPGKRLFQFRPAHREAGVNEEPPVSGFCQIRIYHSARKMLDFHCYSFFDR